MQEQIEILNELSRQLHLISGKVYDDAYLEYKFNPQENWYSFSAWYEQNGRKEIPENFDSFSDDSQKMCESLHDVMHKHTGGDWRKFILTIDKNREVKTQFIYDVQSCMDQFKD